MTILDRANKAPLTPELMRNLLSAVDAMPEQQRRDFVGRGLGLMDFLNDKVPDQGNLERTNVLTAFQFRMEALGRLRKHPGYKAWSLSLSTRKDEPDVIHEALINAAALEPLIEERGQPAFDPDSFFRRVLSVSEAEGQG